MTRGEIERMESRWYRPAQIISQFKIPLRIAFILFLFASLTSTSIHPVTARPTSSHFFDLDTANRISIPTGVADGAMVWGDYDNDGDLDILASGMSIDYTGKTTIFTNTGGTFQEMPAGDIPFEKVQSSSAAWGDYDGDGFLDVLLTGQLRIEGGSNVIGFAGIYHNIPSGGGRSFSLQQQFPNIYQGAGIFFDYNLDGRLDILLTGYTDNGAPFSRIYRNTGNYSSNTVYSSTGTPTVTQLGASSAAWADFDRDGDNDFAISGKNAADEPVTEVYRNNGYGAFTVISLAGLWGGTLNFFDYNLDGYQDLLVTGNSGTNVSPFIEPQTMLYRYYTSSPYYREISNTGLPDVWNSTVSAGDYNNDGYPDLALGGKTLTVLPNRVYLNNQNGTFSDESAGLPDGAGTIMAWGDFDGDLSLDLALTGVAVYDPGLGQERYETYIYPNIPPSVNTPPTAPVMTSACWNRNTQRVTLAWNSATDAPNSSASITYNVRVGTTPGGQEIMSASSDPASGYHRLPQMGNQFSRAQNYAYLLNLPAGDYYWSVQAVDSAFAGGPFDNTIRVINIGTDVAVSDTYALTDSDVNVPLDVLFNDNRGGNQLAILDYENPSHGSLRRDPTNPNILLYTPNSPYQGSDAFAYRAIRSESLYCTRTTVSLSISQDNDPPTDITLSNNMLPDGAPSDTQVGIFTTIDPDANQTFTYTLVPDGTGNNLDNASFHLNGNRLITNTVMDIETKDTYYIRVRSSDGEYSIEKNFTITVVGNQPPSDINLSSTSVLEHQWAGTVVGYLSTIDPDPGNTTFTYALVPDGDNNYDNAQFSIPGSGTPRLVTNAIFDYGIRQTYQVRIRSTDLGGLSVEEVFTIDVQPTRPALSMQATLPIVMSEDGFNSYGVEDPFELTMVATDAGQDEQLTWSISQQASHGVADASGITTSGQQMNIFYTPDANWNSADDRGNDSFVVRITDSSASQFFAEMTITVTVNAVNDPPLFDAITDKAYIEGSGRQSITITGIQPGPLYENGQIVTLAAQCPVQDPCDPNTISDLAVTPVQANGTAILTFMIGPSAGTHTIVVAARDNQPLQNTFSRSFTVTVNEGIKSYLPFIAR